MAEDAMCEDDDVRRLEVSYCTASDGERSQGINRRSSLGPAKIWRQEGTALSTPSLKWVKATREPTQASPQRALTDYN